MTEGNAETPLGILKGEEYFEKYGDKKGVEITGIIGGEDGGLGE